MCLCLKYLACPSKQRVDLGVWEVVFFSVTQEIVYSFFNFFFDVFWNGINLAYTNLSELEEEYLVPDYFFISQRESPFVPDMDFFLLYLNLFGSIWRYRE